MIKKKEKCTQSTYEKFVAKLSAQEKQEFEEEYRELVLQELTLAATQEDAVSVRELAKQTMRLRRN